MFQPYFSREIANALKPDDLFMVTFEKNTLFHCAAKTDITNKVRNPFFFFINLCVCVCVCFFFAYVSLVICDKFPQMLTFFNILKIFFFCLCYRYL